jgi:hypothetical protein
MMGDHARGRRLRARATTSFIASRCSNRGKLVSPLQAL